MQMMISLALRYDLARSAKPTSSDLKLAVLKLLTRLWALTALCSNVLCTRKRWFCTVSHLLLFGGMLPYLLTVCIGDFEVLARFQFDCSAFATRHSQEVTDWNQIGWNRKVLRWFRWSCHCGGTINRRRQSHAAGANVRRCWANSLVHLCASVVCMPEVRNCKHIKVTREDACHYMAVDFQHVEFVLGCTWAWCRQRSSSARGWHP